MDCNNIKVQSKERKKTERADSVPRGRLIKKKFRRQAAAAMTYEVRVEPHRTGRALAHFLSVRRRD